MVRAAAHTLPPTPALAARAVATARAHDCDRVRFGAAAPPGLPARRLRSAAGTGEKGRRRVRTEWGRDRSYATLAELLSPTGAP